LFRPAITLRFIAGSLDRELRFASLAVRFHCWFAFMFFDFSNKCYVIVTSCTYGTWLPGDERGFVSWNQQNGKWVIHNAPGTPCDKDIPELVRRAKALMKESSACFDEAQAETVIEQWLKEAEKKQWTLFNIAVMQTHFHLTASAPVAVNKDEFLRVFKSRASFALNKKFGKRTWWTDGGSVRYSHDEQTAENRIRYVRKQEFKLVYWESPVVKDIIR
jgi:REP element-mobilizing transposase RayT